MHPDAIAIRLRLHLILLETGTVLCPHDFLAKSYNSYSQKLQHVALECKLTLDEENDLLNVSALDGDVSFPDGMLEKCHVEKKSILFFFFPW